MTTKNFLKNLESFDEWLFWKQENKNKHLEARKEIRAIRKELRKMINKTREKEEWK